MKILEGSIKHLCLVIRQNKHGNHYAFINKAIHFFNQFLTTVRIGKDYKNLSKKPVLIIHL